MNTNLDKEAFINEILTSIDGIKQAEVPPFFYTRLMAKIQKEQQPSWWVSIFSVMVKPAFAFATLSLFVVLNVAALNTIIKQKRNYSSTNDGSNATIQTFAQEYNISVSTLYNDSKTIQ